MLVSRVSSTAATVVAATGLARFLVEEAPPRPLADGTATSTLTDTLPVPSSSPATSASSRQRLGAHLTGSAVFPSSTRCRRSGACYLSSPSLPFAAAQQKARRCCATGPAAASTVSTKARDAAAPTAAAAAAREEEVPPAVLQRVASNRQELLRLLRAAVATNTSTTSTSADDVGVSVAKLERVFRKHLALHELLPKGADSSRARKTVPETWMAAMWQTLAHHCYFTLVHRGESRNGDVGISATPALHVLPFDWTATLQQVLEFVPYEGLSEREFQTHLQLRHRVWATHPPMWSLHYTGATSLPQWVHRRFASLFTVTRSAVTDEAVFHRATANSISMAWTPLRPATNTSPSSFVSDGAASSSGGNSAARLQLQHALHTLGRGHQLPVWTDVADLAPLLPQETGLNTTKPAVWKEAWLADVELRRAFSIDSFIRVRAAAASKAILAVVDCTSVRPVELQRVWNAFVARSCEGSSGHTRIKATVKLLTRPNLAAAAKEAFRKVFASGLGDTSAVLVEEVVVDTLLEPHHLLAALLETHPAAASATPEKQPASFPAASLSSRREVLVFCGDGSRESFQRVLDDTGTAGATARLITPAAAAP